MRATVMYGAADVPIEELRERTDALVRVVRACSCGSDLWRTGPGQPTTRAGASGTSASA